MINNFDKFNLSEDIIKSLNGLGYIEPTDVQEKVIPVALNNQDIIVKSKTGSGKTLAFGIPICENIDWEENKPQALILTPTRELAEQIKDELNNVGRFKRLKASAIYGKSPFKPQILELKQKTHIVVGTPGRILDHIERKTISLEKVKYLILDEADEMLNMGFIEQVEYIILNTPRDRVTMLFSATIPDDIGNLCDKYMNNPTSIEIANQGVTANEIDHYVVEVYDSTERLNTLKDVLIAKNPDSCIIFCNTKDTVDMVCDELKKERISCDKIHGGMEQRDRLKAMNGFKSGRFRYLVATDVAARGIDVENVSLVINYELPEDSESYVHRTGRTGRAGKKGEAVSFAGKREFANLMQIERFIGFKLKDIAAPSEEEISKNRSAFKDKQLTRVEKKIDKSKTLSKDITKLYFNGGKKKKLRAVDFVGTISNIDGVCADDIGIIDIQDTVSYVDILNGKGKIVLDALKNTTIKGKKLKVERARK